MILPQADEAPQDIVISRDRRTVSLSDGDGDVRVLGAERLRLSCRCAWCTRDRIIDRFPKRFEGISIADVSPIGGHALHIAFSDGHARGIFPWRYLHEIGDAPAPFDPSTAEETDR
jgi:DUF971 family protein